MFKHLDYLKGEVDLKVPIGTQPGDRVVLRNRGVPVLNGGGRRGHQYVHFNVVVPQKLSDRQKELLEEFRKEEEENGNSPVISISGVTAYQQLVATTLRVSPIGILTTSPIGLGGDQ